MAVFLGIILIIWLIALAFGILMYVFQSLGLYTIAKRRGIDNPWLAWIPVGYQWILGCVSDQYQYVAKGQVKSKRKLLLVLSIISLVLSVVTLIGSIGVFTNLIINLADEVSVEQYEYYYGYSDDMLIEDTYNDEALENIGAAASSMAGFYGSSMIASVINIVMGIFVYIALFDLYRSSDPGNATLFLVLGILFSVAQPFFIFACRNKDGGMPPRMAPVQPAAWNPAQPTLDTPAWNPPAPPAEPWENTSEE